MLTRILKGGERKRTVPLEENHLEVKVGCLPADIFLGIKFAQTLSQESQSESEDG